MRFQGFGWGITDTAKVRVALTLLDARDEPWRYLFRQSSKPVGDDQFALAYASHGIVGNEVYVELEPASAERVVIKALDWLSTIAATVAEEHRTIVQVASRVGDSVRMWSPSHIG